MRIDGKKIYIKSITYNDTDDIIKWRNRSFVRDNFIFRTTFTRKIHENWMKNMVETGKVIQFIMYTKSDDRKIGSVYLRDIDEANKKCEFGIFIGEEDCLSKGYGREAADLICNYAFSNLDIYKILLRVLAGNERALNSYKKSGFSVEGKFNADVWLDGEPVDVIFMARFNPDYKK